MPDCGGSTVAGREQRVDNPADLRAEPSRYVCIRVVDEGGGMTQAQLEHVCERFV